MLIVEADPSLAARLSAALTRERVTVMSGFEQAAELMASGAVNVGIVSSLTCLRTAGVLERRLIPWIVLIDSMDDEFAMHHGAPDMNAQFLLKDPEQRYLELIPLRIRAAPSRERVIEVIAHRFPGMVAYWNADERCLFANAAYLHWFGVTVRDLLGKTLRDLLGPVYPLNEPYIRGALRGEPQRFERTLRDPAGGPPRHAFAIYTPDVHEGVVRGFIAFVTDISEQAQLRQTLEEREHRWATLFDILPVGVTVVDAGGAVVDQNPAILSILGIDREGFDARQYKNNKYIHSNGQPVAQSEFPSRRALAERSVVGPVDIGILREDKTTRWTSVTAAPFPNEDKVVVVTLDTTAEKASEARFEAIVDASPIPYALNDDHGNITYLNRAFVAAFGYTREDIPTLEQWWPLAYPDAAYRAWVAKEWSARYEKSKRENMPFEPMELTIRTKDGSIKLVNAGAVALAGTLAGGHLVVLVDITEQRKAAKQLEENRRLASLGTLVGGIAHDFNNLLTPILAHVDVALTEVPPSNPLFTGLSEIQQAATRATALVRQILTVGRPGDESKTNVDVVALVEEIVHLLRASLPASIALRTHIEHQAPTIRANPTRIHQVILNLATNARDAMDGQGGVLTIGVARAEGNRLRLSVSDTGAGIKPEIMDRVFEPYFSTKMATGGTGLGLTTVRSIVTSLGGTITMRSEPGRGTTVDVFIPAISEVSPLMDLAEPALQPVPSAPVTLRGHHILVVDDEPLVGRAVVRMLMKLGHRVTLTYGPEEALDAFRADATIEVVLTDYTMPGMSGIELAPKMYEIRPIPVLLTTGNAERLSDPVLREAHVLRILSKPYGTTELSEALAAALSDPM